MGFEYLSSLADEVCCCCVFLLLGRVYPRRLALG